MLVLQLELSLFGFSVLFGYVVSFPFGTSRLLFFFRTRAFGCVISLSIGRRCAVSFIS